MHKVATTRKIAGSEKAMQTCARVLLQMMEVMQLHYEQDWHKEVELQSELRHDIDVLIDETRKC